MDFLVRGEIRNPDRFAPAGFSVTDQGNYFCVNSRLFRFSPTYLCEDCSGKLAIPVRLVDALVRHQGHLQRTAEVRRENSELGAKLHLDRLDGALEVTAVAIGDATVAPVDKDIVNDCSIHLGDDPNLGEVTANLVGALLDSEAIIGSEGNGGRGHEEGGKRKGSSVVEILEHGDFP